MEALTRISFISLAAADLLLWGTAGALAHSPVVLTNAQLDRVTAGAFVAGASDAQSAGVFALSTTTGSSFVVQDASPYPGNPGLGPTSGVVEGTALAVGTNLGLQGEPSPSSNTAVITGGSAQGNLVINSTINQTVHGAGGVTFQAGWTFVYGAWVGL
jgi:hypothetical protein